MGITTLLSVWPHFSAGTRSMTCCARRAGSFTPRTAFPTQVGPQKSIGPNIDTTDPDAAKWWWEAIRDRYIKPYDFDYLWLDETEPDIDPAKDFFSIGSGSRYYNVYPLLSHSFGVRRIPPRLRRQPPRHDPCPCRLPRSATQWHGVLVERHLSTWDMLKRSIPAGLNFTASGMAYWDTDIAGFFSPTFLPTITPQHPPLVDPSDVRGTVGQL